MGSVDSDEEEDSMAESSVYTDATGSDGRQSPGAAGAGGAAVGEEVWTVDPGPDSRLVSVQRHRLAQLEEAAGASAEACSRVAVLEEQMAMLAEDCRMRAVLHAQASRALEYMKAANDELGTQCEEQRDALEELERALKDHQAAAAKVGRTRTLAARRPPHRPPNGLPTPGIARARVLA